MCNNRINFLWLEDIRWLLKKLLLILAFMFIIRIVFLAINYAFFSDIPLLLIIRSFIYSVRIDIAGLLILNGWLILLIAFFPSFSRRYPGILNLVFVILNGLLLVLYLCDLVFLEYTQRRLSADVLLLIPQSFTAKLLLIYLASHWYWLLMLMCMALITRIWKTPEIKAPVQVKLKTRLLRGLILSIICLILIRGVGRRPQSPATALMYFPPKLTTLVSNTVINLLYSAYSWQRGFEEKKYYSAEELNKKNIIYHQISNSSPHKRSNIVLFVMESFARGYLDSTSIYKAKTPFLDSVLKQSLVFNNAVSNGNQSTDGLISILASLPPFMDIPYYHSSYNSVQMNGMGSMLQSLGYDCSFFLGDVENSFGFEEFTKSIGISHYYGMKEFGNDKLYNGAWGIHDHYFLPYAASVLLKKPEPYFAVVYNVSSHPPFIIPDECKKQFTIKGQNEEQNSISYVDYAYRCYFDKVKNDPSFFNTVFIFIADHFYPPSRKKSFNAVNYNEIPFFIFKPGSSALRGSRNYIVQQMDVLPTILELTGYNGRYMSFGSNVFDNDNKRYSVQRRQAGIYQIVDSSYVLQFNANTDSVLSLYDYRKDTILARNLVEDSACFAVKNELSGALKAMIQRYIYSFKHNSLLYE